MNNPENIDPHILPNLTLKVIWASGQIREETDRQSVGAIVDFLVNKSKIAVNFRSVRRVLDGNKKFFHKDKNGYSLMEEGVKELTMWGAEDRIILLEPGKPFSTKTQSLKKMLGKLSGTIKICDPYFDVSLLDFIYINFSKKTSIEILTHKVNDRPSGTIIRILNEMQQEGYKVEVRAISNNILHDRYLIDDSRALLSGNSFSHLGTKESFIIGLGEDTRQSILSTFNNRWKAANKI